MPNKEHGVFKRSINIQDLWEDSEELTITANQVGTPCLRYIVRQPDEHQDVDLRDSGEFSFSAFGYRREIGGEITKKRRSRLAFDRYPLYTYCPDFAEPFNHDLFGATVPNLFHFEVLDPFEQKKSLVGSAHLHMHAPDMRGAVVVSFNPNGTLRYIESRMGSRRGHDSVFSYEDRSEFKIGTNLTGRKIVGQTIFGVPRWAFSEDISAKIVHYSDVNQDPVVSITNNLPNNESLRFGHPEKPTNFLNRKVGIEAVVHGIPRDVEKNTLKNIGDVESSSVGKASAHIEISNFTTSVLLVGESNTVVNLEVEHNAWHRLAENLQTLPYHDLTSLDIDTVADYSEYLYLYFHKLLSLRGGNKVSIS